MIVAVAVLLLPALGGLLLGMTWWEERLFRASGAPRHAGTRRHLRLVRGGRDTPARTSEQRRHAA
ncbi:hypothetical protein ACFWMJ_03335 [Streptomyces hawaiiensis]|uniref:hypothetical protein n=1 Tax=Streptomyces hawaiiensis TaxID=67305 RepID=UPI00365C7863